jgi:hypothetical protein
MVEAEVPLSLSTGLELVEIWLLNQGLVKMAQLSLVVKDIYPIIKNKNRDR